MRFSLYYIAISLFIGCSSGILKGQELSSSDLAYIKSLGLLNDEESIVRFSSSMNLKSSGNFYTDKRIAAYWIYSDEDERYSAYYHEIQSIDLNYGDGLEYASKLIVSLKDNTSFEVYFNCEKEEIDKIYEEVKKFLE